VPTIVHFIDVGEGNMTSSSLLTVRSCSYAQPRDDSAGDSEIGGPDLAQERV
jgi:hypothetical protein